MATVKYTKGTDGKETVVAVSEATANAVTAADAPKMHSESVTKTTGPTASTKTKTETVIGIVKEYEAGKSIKVTGPKTKDYSFDLTDMAALKKRRDRRRARQGHVHEVGQRLQGHDDRGAPGQGLTSRIMKSC